MSLTKEEIEKVYKLRDSLKMTYRLSTNKAQKIRVGQTLQELEEIIQKIEKGQWVNPVKVHLYTKKPDKDAQEESGEESRYREKIAFVKLAESNKDSEMDEMYSYLLFFEDTFITFLKSEDIKLEYEFSRKRNDFIMHFNTLRRLVDEYISDIEGFTTFSTTEQHDHYRDRLMHQKNYILIKLSEVLVEIRGVLKELAAEYEKGSTRALLNGDEEFRGYLNSSKSNIFEGAKVIEIIYATLDFIKEFNTNLRIPNFKKR